MLVRYIIQGKVQGVGYRYFTLQTAESLKVYGWVKNLSGGEVECMAQAGPAVLKEFEFLLRKGPLASKVLDIQSKRIFDDERFTDFTICH